MFKQKTKFCINSNLIDPKFIKELSKKFKIITIKQLIPKNLSPADSEILTKADSKDYHIITRNITDFKNLFYRSHNIKIGLVGIDTKEYMETLPNLIKLLNKKIKSHQNLYRKFLEIDSEGFVIYNKNRERIIPKTFWKNLDEISIN